jgi:S1-C subfamily serine protease
MKIFKNTNTHLVLGLFLTLLNSAVLAYLVFSGINVQVKANENKDKIVVEDVQAEDLSKLSSQLVYSGTKGSDTNYYSPSLDSLLKYDSSKYNINENTNYINISPNSYNFSIFTKVNIVSKGSEDILVTRLKYFTDIFDKTKKESEGKIGELDYIKLSYSSQNLFDSKKEATTQYVMIIKREVGEKVVVAEIKYSVQADLDAISNDIVALLKSIEISPKNIEQNIKAGIKDIGLELEYDRSKWTVSSHFDSSLYLTYLSEFETDKNLKNSYSSLSISGGKNFKNEESSKILDEHIGYDQDSHKDDSFKMIDNKKEVDLNGVKFIYSTYSYTFVGENVYIKQMVGVKGDRYAVVKFLTPTFESESTKALETVLKSFKFSEVVALNSNAVLGTGTLQIDKAAILGKPAVVHIFNRTCTNIRVSSNPTLQRSGGKSYDLCSAGTGTGFYVSNDGYIVTNGHVATPSALDSTAMGLLNSQSTPNKFWLDFAYDVGTILAQQGMNVSSLSNEQVVMILIAAYKELIDTKTIALTTVSENYIENGTPFVVDRYSYKLSNESKHFKATTIAGQVDSQLEMYLNSAKGTQVGITKPDLAILKVQADTKDLPILKLSDPSQMSVGQEINVIGFPGSAENSTIFAANSTSTATITNGSISAIKPNQGNTFNLIQIDASVSYGNSGGPVLNSEGQVVAVTTYKISANESADFNAGVSVAEVKKYLDANNVKITNSQVSEVFESGINNFAKSYFKLAIVDFNKVIELYPQASEIVQPLINISNQKIKDGEDKSPFFNFSVIDRQLEKMNINVSFQTILISLFVLIALIVSIVITLKALKNRKNSSNVPPVQPPTPVVEQPMVTPAPFAPPVQPTIAQAPMVDMPVPIERNEMPTQQVQSVVPPVQSLPKETIADFTTTVQANNPQAPFPTNNQ